jgi:hypothetical protein
MAVMGERVRCSFCGKSDRTLIAGQGAHICAECALRCIEFFLKEEQIKPAGQLEPAPLPSPEQVAWAAR